MAENLILALRALGLPFRVHDDFEDEHADRFLGLDPKREVTLAVISVPGPSVGPEKGLAGIPPLRGKIGEAGRVAGLEKDYPTIGEIHRAGARPGPPRLSPEEERHEEGLSFQSREPLDRNLVWPEVMDVGEAVFQRRSRRNFVRRPLAREAMMSLVDALCSNDPGKPARKDFGVSMLQAGFLSLAVEGLAPGFYGVDTVQKEYGMIVPGDLGEDMAHICLDQSWLKQAGAHFFFLADFDFLDRRWGARAYRYAMLAAGRLGERLYLATTAMGLGCCGIGAFYDREAARLLGLEGGMRLLYLTAVGVVKRM